MSAPVDPTGFKSKEWITVVGHSVMFFLNDASKLWIVANDAEFPSGWQIQLHKPAADPVVIHPDWLPIKAGALEWARGWMEKNNRYPIPTPEQRAQPWFDQKYDKPESDMKVIQPGEVVAKQAASKVAAENEARIASEEAAKRREWEAQRTAEKINAMLRGEREYTCKRGHSPNSYFATTATCPECGSIGSVVP